MCKENHEYVEMLERNYSKWWDVWQLTNMLYTVILIRTIHRKSSACIYSGEI